MYVCLKESPLSCVHVHTVMALLSAHVPIEENNNSK